MKGYRTLILNAIGSILPALQALDVTQVLNPQGAALYALGLALANGILRLYTNTPVGQAK